MGSETMSAQYGGLVSRLLAFVIDLIIIAIISFLATAVTGIIAEFFDLSFIRDIFGGAGRLSVSPLQALVAFLAGLISAMLAFVYFIFFWVLVGFTPGKGLLGLRIVRADGQRIGLGRAVMRYVGYWVSLIFLGLGFIWILFDQRRRGWHDKLAGTCVVYFDEDFTFFRK